MNDPLLSSLATGAERPLNQTRAMRVRPATTSSPSQALTRAMGRLP